LNLSKGSKEQKLWNQGITGKSSLVPALVLFVFCCNSLFSQSDNCNTTSFPDQWQVHELQNSELPFRSVYILPQEDLNGDGLKDIVTGQWWYRNPGSASGNWVRKTIGNPFKNVAYLHDFDGDGDIDLLGTQGAYTGADLAWAENDGSGNFTVHTNIPSGNTNYSEPFLAGIAGARFQSGGPFQMAINWNGAESTGSPVQMLTVPTDPVNTTWSLVDTHPDSLGEDLREGDIDDDGDLDLFQSSNWLRNNGNGSWTTIPTGISYVTTPDRAQLADFDGDGDLDAVVGQLSLGTSSSAKTEFAWFEAPANPTQTWTRHVLATDINGSLSVVASDIDLDGDKDIVVGEWKGSNRLIVFENDLCNSGNWIRQTINAGGTGFDHHDGAQVVDIDNDGDFDIVSIGWDNIVPRIFENKSSTSSSLPIANAGDNQSITLPVNTITLNGSGNDPDGGSVSYQWTQRSGPNTATLTNANMPDLKAGDLIAGAYVFGLTVTDNESDSAFDDLTLTVFPAVVIPLSAQAEATPLTGTSPLEVAFTGSNSTGEITSYSWDFKDGNTSEETNPVHTFTDLGSYEVVLIVSDDGGMTDSDTITINVSEPVVELSAQAEATPLTGISPLEVTFTGSGSTGEITSYSWDFMDGNTSVETNPVHTFSDSGSYEVVLTVSDDGGMTSSDTIIINVSEPVVELSAQAEATPLTGTSPLEVTFTGSGSTGEITSYLWDFKDGNTSDEANPVHTFTDPGIYEVVLTVSDDSGMTNTDTIIINVSEAVSELSAQAEATPLTGTSPLEVTFTGSGSTGGITSYSWDFKDGNTSEETNPLHTFNDPGSYEVVLKVTDDGGMANTDKIIINVSEPVSELSAQAEATSLTGTSPLEVTFTGSNSAGEIASYSWDFKDGNTSDEANPVHTFTDAGNYEVELIVTDLSGETSTASIIITVNEMNDGDEMAVILENNPSEKGIARIRVMNRPEVFKISTINLHDQLGRLIGSFTANEVMVDNAYQIPIQTLRDGLYYFNIEIENAESVELKLLVRNR